MFDGGASGIVRTLCPEPASDNGEKEVADEWLDSTENPPRPCVITVFDWLSFGTVNCANQNGSPETQ